MSTTLNLVEAVLLDTPLYTVFLCADDGRGSRYGIEVTGFAPRILVEVKNQNAIEEILEDALYWQGVDRSQIRCSKLDDAMHLCG